ncbi:hypothetical protein FRC10_004408 [Ceratobasidium sp. 414]|nr:hypothetical protein FRC10_004408 [Ceratobasidium sp. 414]
MAAPSGSPSSKLTPEQAINLATERDFHQSNLGHLKYPYAQFQGDGTAAAGYPPAAGQLAPRFATNLTPNQVSVPSYGFSLNSSARSPALNVSVTGEQINLATRSSLVPDNISPNTTYDQPPGFGLPYGSPFYHSYSGTFPANRTGGVEIDANEAADFDYTYTTYGPSPPPLSVGYDMHNQEPNSCLNDLQHAPGGSLLGAGSMGELYLGNSQLASVHADIPEPSDTERRDSEATLKLPLHPENPFERTFTNFPIESDSWSSAAFSSPSLGSFNSSPSTQNNPSTFGTPFLDFDDSQHRFGEPLLNGTQPHNPQRLSLSLGSIPPSELPTRERRGAISQQGHSVFVGNSNHPMLDDSTAHQLYADNFQIEGGSNQFTSAVSRSSDQISTPSPFREAYSPSEPSAATHESLASTCSDVKAESARASPDASALGGPSSLSKSADSSHFHPYARPVKMSEHEQLILFDNTPVAESSRKSKRSKGSKRCYCKYVCPVKGKQCDNSVSRDADMSRHLHKHKSEEAEMIAAGVLAPENATDFGDLKPTGAAVCKGCGIPMSRKDALVRHLKKSGKSCRAFYPDIVLK